MCVSVALACSTSSTEGSSQSGKSVLVCHHCARDTVTSHLLLLGFEGSASVIQKKSLPGN